MMRKQLALLKLLFAAVAVLIGAGIVVWVLWNAFIARQPEYERPPLAGPLGVGPVMIAVGVFWTRSAITALRGM